MQRHDVQHGFTLIELMIAVAIVAILTMIAVPSYSSYIMRGHLADAASGLAATRAQMERFYQDNRTYNTVGTFTTPCDVAVAKRTYGSFIVSCAATPTATAFTLQAVGSGSVAGFTFTINETDVRATTAAVTGWNTCANKWLMKKGEAC